MNELVGSLGAVWTIFIIFMGILLFLMPLYVMLINSKMGEIVRQLRRMNKNQVEAYKLFLKVNPEYELKAKPDYDI
jgi:hypothetical protein